MPVKLAPPPRQQYENANGIPYVGGKLFTYAAGSTTKQTTYTDSAGGTANTNPIILDSAGRTPFGMWLTEGLKYKFVLAPSTDTDPPTSPIFTEDGIAGVNDTATTTSQWIASGATPTYISATQFTLVGDKTADFHVGRRVKFTVTAGTVYGRISVTAYTTLTTVTIVGGALDSGLSAVELSALTATNHAIPVLVAADLQAIGIQPLDATLTALAAQVTAANNVQAYSGPDATLLLSTGTASGNIPLVGTTSATETIAGLSEIATQAEAVAGTADNVVMTPLKARQAQRILQVVHLDTGAVATGTTIIPLDDTIPQQTEGDQYMTLAITPIAANSILRVDVTANMTPSVSAWLITALFRDAGVDSVGVLGAVSSGISGTTATGSIRVTAGSTATTTFKVRVGMDRAGTTTFNGVSAGRIFGGAMASSIRITEIAA